MYYSSNYTNKGPISWWWNYSKIHCAT